MLALLSRFIQLLLYMPSLALVVYGLINYTLVENLFLQNINH
nr:MAG TPA: hypothetical protein [Caudoviricetes sp.]